MLKGHKRVQYSHGVHRDARVGANRSTVCDISGASCLSFHLEDSFLDVTVNLEKDWEIGDTAIIYLEKRRMAVCEATAYLYTVYSNEVLNKQFLIGIKARGK